MFGGIEAVGFDIDGTLYPETVMYLCSIPAFCRAPFLMARYGRMRREIRDLEPAASPGLFREQQAHMVLEAMHREVTPERTRELLERIDTRIYRTWEHSFSPIRPFAGVLDLFKALSAASIRVGLLSDLPLGIKPAALGVEPYCDVLFSAEDTGQLKPHSRPFERLAREFGVDDPAKVLYVGNSYSKDIIGAKRAGMRTALYIHPVHRRQLGGSYPDADLVFSSYPALKGILLN